MENNLPAIKRNAKLRFVPSGTLSKLLPLAVPITVLNFSDSILAYVAPIYAQKLFINEFHAGLAIAFSSAVGFLVDYFSHRIFGNRDYAFFIKITFILSIAFSLLLGLSYVNKYIFILSMAVWGIYYETLAFSNYKYIKRLSREDFSRSWATIATIKAFLYALGPLAATYLLTQNHYSPVIACGLFVLIAFSLYAVSTSKHRHSEHLTQPPDHHTPEIRVWLVLMKKVYSIWMLYFILIVIDSAFWTVGIFMAQSLSAQTPLASLILTVYMLPAIVFSQFSAPLSARYGKKRTAIVCAVLGSVFLSLTGLVDNIKVLLFFIFVYSAFVSISLPAISATFEDFIKRLGEFDADLISLEQSSPSLAYIVGPVLAGFLAMSFSEQRTFFVLGLLLGFIAILSLIITPKKIRMPQSELSKID